MIAMTLLPGSAFRISKLVEVTMSDKLSATFDLFFSFLASLAVAGFSCSLLYFC